MDLSKESLDMLFLEPGGTVDYEQCWKNTGCSKNIVTIGALTSTYFMASKTKGGWFEVKDIPRTAPPPVLFKGTIKTHFRDDKNDYDYDDVSDITVTHIGTGDPALADEQAFRNLTKGISDLICKELRGGGTRAC
jgi:hypothetical protein